MRENRNLNFELKINKNTFNYFDNRFMVTSKYDGNLIKSKKSYHEINYIGKKNYYWWLLSN